MASKKAIGIKVKPPKNGGRRLVITDIHGCYRTFDELLKKVELTEDDQLFLLGDFINRGPRSKQVLDRVLTLIEEGYNVYPLMGNHEENLLHIAAENPDELPYLLKPRNSTGLLNEHGNLKARFFRFLRKLPYYYKLDDYYLVHAGFNLALENPFADTHAMAWMRNFSLDKKLNGRKVLFGHTPTKFSKITKNVINNSKSLCLDNGCAHTYLGSEYGHLLCYNLDSKELVRQKNID